jgi:hypothetical protein
MGINMGGFPDFDFFCYTHEGIKSQTLYTFTGSAVSGHQTYIVYVV